MTAKSFYEEKHGVHSHTLPKSAVIELMEQFHTKMSNFEKAREKFNTEKFVANHNFEQSRRSLKNQNHQP